MPDILPEESNEPAISCVEACCAPFKQVFTLRDTVLLQTLMRPMLWLSLTLSIASIALRCKAEAARAEADDYEISGPANHFTAESDFASSTISVDALNGDAALDRCDHRLHVARGHGLKIRLEILRAHLRGRRG